MRIAIIGLGTAGACMLDSLHHGLAAYSDIDLTLYDAADQPWRGRAFQDDSLEIVANAPVEGMSIRHGDLAHAERWLVDHGHLPPAHPHEVFLPRALYGEYMTQHAGELVEDLTRRGWRVQLIKHRATALTPLDSSGYVVESEGRRDTFDYVILCAGGSVYVDTFELGGIDGFIANPYPTFERLRGIPSDAAVGVLGSGLAAVDVAVALNERGHTGPIRMYSRSGTLPLVRRPGPEWTPKYLTVDRLVKRAPSDALDQLAGVERLFNREVRAWGGAPQTMFASVPKRDPRGWLRWQLEHPHDRTDLATFIFQKSVPTVWQDIWYGLRPAEQRRILASPATQRAIMSSCCPMPRSNAEKMLAMLDVGQLKVTGGLTSVARRNGAFDVRMGTLRDRADYIVSAVTPSVYGVHPQMKPLVDTAVAHGLARRHHGGGVEVLARSSALVGDRPPGRLYALGDLTRGAFFFTFGLPVLVRRSADIARAIHDDIDQQARPATPPPSGHGHRSGVAHRPGPTYQSSR